MDIRPIGRASRSEETKTLWQPEFSWILNSLAVGASFPRGVAERLALECGIRAVIDVRIEDSDHPEELAFHVVAFLHLPTEDACAVSQEMLDEACASLARLTRPAAGC
jgi:hypothetical protein